MLRSLFAALFTAVLALGVVGCPEEPAEKPVEKPAVGTATDVTTADAPKADSAVKAAKDEAGKLIEKATE